MFSLFGSSLKALSLNLYKCTRCGYEVTVNRMLQPSEQTCPICHAHLYYRGSAK